MWKISEIETADNFSRFQILENNQTISFQGWTEQISNDEDFIKFYINHLASIPFDAFFWEVKPTNKLFWESAFEFVITNSVSLANIKANKKSFSDKFISGEPVVVFPNLGKDALLIVPCPFAQDQAYGHMADFIRHAPLQQKLAFWTKVGLEYQSKITEDFIWLSTAGLGVPWLHVRLDSKPKYYRYQPYKKAIV